MNMKVYYFFRFNQLQIYRPVDAWRNEKNRTGVRK